MLTAEQNGVTQSNGTTHNASDSSAGRGSHQVKGTTLTLKQFHALLVKRFHHATRSQKDFLAQVQQCSEGYKAGWTFQFSVLWICSVETWRQGVNIHQRKKSNKKPTSDMSPKSSGKNNELV